MKSGRNMQSLIKIIVRQEEELISILMNRGIWIKGERKRTVVGMDEKEIAVFSGDREMVSSPVMVKGNRKTNFKAQEKQAKK